MKFTGEESFLNFFSDIAAIPHGSGNLDGIVGYLKQFAEKRGLSFYTDKTHNVFIKKAGSAGRENEKAIVLQAHIDMVCEKNAGVEHDFLHEGIKLIREDDILRADGTTLGGDDGMGVSTILALLDDEKLSHPPLECLFTADEETGMYGAAAFDYSLLSTNILLNLDGGNEEHITTGCAGGIHVFHEYTAERVEDKTSALQITLGGLKGGHSGAAIRLDRANAIQKLSDMLCALYDEEPFNLIDWNGGNKMNAIPRECTATISVFDRKAAGEKLKELFSDLKKEVRKEDGGICFTVKNTKNPGETPLCFTHRDTRRLLTLASSIRSGVISLAEGFDHLPETSGNLANVHTDGEKVKFGYSLRSLYDSKLAKEVLRQKMIAREFDCAFSTDSSYPAWEYSENSQLQTKYRESLEKITGKKARTQLVHAGLECGIMSGHIPHLDAISVGSNLYDIHTPKEKASISSAVSHLKVICDLLEKSFS